MWVPWSEGLEDLCVTLTGHLEGEKWAQCFGGKARRLASGWYGGECSESGRMWKKCHMDCPIQLGGCRGVSARETNSPLLSWEPLSKGPARRTPKIQWNHPSEQQGDIIKAICENVLESSSFFLHHIYKEQVVSEWVSKGGWPPFIPHHRQYLSLVQPEERGDIQL
jgi:hypothetical protein